MLHLSCVKQHMRAERSPLGWHCPTCHNTQIEKPQYTCWCGKQVKPLPLPGLPPHSCGQTCSRVSPMLAPSATDDNDQPPLKHNSGMVSHINTLIEKTKSELKKADEEHKARERTSEAFSALKRLKRRLSGLVDV